MWNKISSDNTWGTSTLSEGLSTISELQLLRNSIDADMIIMTPKKKGTLDTYLTVLIWNNKQYK